MANGSNTIGLCMIVKDEAELIRRCLASALPLVDYILVVDTGSADGTQQVVRDFIDKHGVRGQVIDEPWRDFAYNRSFALQRLREVSDIDYALILDADDVLVIEPGFDLNAFKAQMCHDHYDVLVDEGAVTHYRGHICSNRLPYAYRGVLHEYLDAPPGERGHAKAAGLSIQASRGGARSRNPRKYHDDAALLERALAVEADPFLIARYTFYLAQSYRDCGEKEKALENYLKRAELGYWDQEIFFSLYEAAKIKEELGADADEVIALYLRASDAATNRAEARHGASRLCRRLGRNKQGYEIGRRGLYLTAPADGLFVEPWIYDYGLHDEFAVNAYWAGHDMECLDACLKILKNESLPTGERTRIAENAQFAVDRLAKERERAGEIKLAPADIDAEPATLPAPSILPPRAVSGRVSIITPTHGRSRFLREAAAHVRRQHYPDIEWLILDDSRAEHEACADLAGPNVFYQRVDTKLSIGKKRNRLIERAKGEFIVQFDDDDFYSPHYVTTMISSLIDSEADLINLRGWFLHDLRSQFFGYWNLEHKLGPHYRCDRDSVSLVTLTPENNQGFASNHLGFGFSYAFRKKVWESVPFPDIDFNEDGEFSLRAAERFKLAGIHDTRGICLHRLHPGSTSRCFPQYHLPRHLLAALFPQYRGDPGAQSPPPNSEHELCLGEVRPDRSEASELGAGRPMPSGAPAPRLIFLHSSWRTSSTWFWSKFRPLAETECYYEPFSGSLSTITRDQAAASNYRDWDSAHQPTEPYFREYLPFVEETGGLRLFDPAMPFGWFFPIGGLRGELRPAETRYLAQLIDHARQLGKIPVFGETASLGRLRAIKNTFGGRHIFLHRNLWKQWLSYLYQRRRLVYFIYDTTARIVGGSDEPFVAGIADLYLDRALAFRRRAGGETQRPLSADERFGLLRWLPEHDAFAMFMALNLYLYLHAQISADLTVDATRLAADAEYRTVIEAALARLTGLEISLSDVADAPSRGIAINAATIDWNEIQAHARAAAAALRAFADPAKSIESAAAFVDAAMAEMEKSEAALALRSDADDEIWFARLQNARCHWGLGDEEGFVGRALELCKERPDRGEPLFDLARFHRERGMYEKAMAFAEAGLALGRPGDDGKFVEDFVYKWGLHEEISIAGFYCVDPARKKRGRAACEWLALNPDIPTDKREQAQRNLVFYGKPQRPSWIPVAPAGGTEIMLRQLQNRMARELDGINLEVNKPCPNDDPRPRVVWMQNDVDQVGVQWCKDKALVGLVDRLVFVSHWQRERYLKTFGLPPERCVVLRNSTEVDPMPRRWEAGPVWRCAYTSTPYRGLSVLLDAWERLSPGNAELHIWSSVRLYRWDDTPYEHLYDRAESMPGVFYHGIAPNDELRAALRDMHFLVYPCTFQETSCIAVIEAMAAGCRVVAPDYGALAETTAGFGRLYPWIADAREHAEKFAEELADELPTPWRGQPELSLAQHEYCLASYDWGPRLAEWRQLIASLKWKQDSGANILSAEAQS